MPDLRATVVAIDARCIAQRYVDRMQRKAVMTTHVRFFRSWSLRLSLLALAAVAPAVAQDATVTIFATDSIATEGGSDTGTFTVRRTAPTNFPLAVFYQLSGTASNGADYELLGNSVEIPSGAFEASFTVKPIADALYEGNESVRAQLTGSPLACATCGYRIGVPDSAVIFILDTLGTNYPPSVELTEPRNGATFPASADIRLAASAFDPDGFFGTVEFFEGTNSLGLGTNTPLTGYFT